MLEYLKTSLSRVLYYVNVQGLDLPIAKKLHENVCAFQMFIQQLLTALGLIRLQFFQYA
jgi:hypothetical protein